jgi:nucleotide-binding universal stress UspA family protein
VSCAQAARRGTIPARHRPFQADAAAPERTMSRKRRSYEAGHSAKFLVVVDDTPECDRALYFASRRAARVGVSVIMLRVIDTHDRNQQWLGVADIMRAEAHEEAKTMLDNMGARANGIAGITPEQVIREGDTAEEILRLIDEDEDISVLVLAAGIDKEGPGPLVANLGSTAGTFPVPIAIVPGHLSDEDLDAMS